MSGDSSHLKIEDFLKGEPNNAEYLWSSLPDNFEDAQQQSFNSSDTFGDACGSKRMSSPEARCGLSREDAQDLISSDEPCLGQMPYMQMPDMMQAYDDPMFYGTMQGQAQQPMYCPADSSGAVMDETLSGMGLHNMLPQMSENSGASTQSVGPTEMYPQQWVGRQAGPGSGPSGAGQPPQMVQAYQVMAYPMPHQYHQGKRMTGGYQMVGYYPGNPTWQYTEGPCGPGWMAPAPPMHMMEMDMRMNMHQQQQQPMHPGAMGMHNPMQPMRQSHAPAQMQQHCTMPCGNRPGPWGQPQPQRPAMQYYHPATQMSSASVTNLPNCRPNSGGPSPYPNMPPIGLSGGCYPAQGHGPGPPCAPKDEARDMWLQRGPAAAVQPPRAASPSPCETPRSCVADRESEQEDEEISDDEDPGGTEEVLHRPVVEPLKVPHHHTSATRAAPHKEEAAWSPRRQGAAPTAKCSRMECLERYREKKRKRLHQPTVRYHMRKINADNRPRIKGRFVKASKTSDAVELYGL